MAEEHGFRASEGHRLCPNNCGFFGSPATQNFCAKCYNDLSLNKPVPVDPQISLPSSSVGSSPHPAHSSADSSPATAVPELAQVTEAAAPPLIQPNRCSACRRKVGLTGFRCRCGTTFCGTHRYPEQHGCTFDFKTMGREAIAKENPVIRGRKLEKI